MTWVNHRMNSAQPLRMCSKCGQMRIPEDGIQASPTRWVCGSCWRQRASAPATPVKKGDK